MVIPLRGIGSVWEGLGGGRHKPKQGGEPDEFRRINIISFLGFHSFEFPSFHETSGCLFSEKMASACLSPRKQRKSTLQLLLFQGETLVLQFTATPQHCQPLLGTGFHTGHAFNSKGMIYYLQSNRQALFFQNLAFKSTNIDSKYHTNL